MVVVSPGAGPEAFGAPIVDRQALLHVVCAETRAHSHCRHGVHQFVALVCRVPPSPLKTEAYALSNPMGEVAQQMTQEDVLAEQEEALGDALGVLRVRVEARGVYRLNADVVASLLFGPPVLLEGRT